MVAVATGRDEQHYEVEEQEDEHGCCGGRGWLAREQKLIKGLSCDESTVLVIMYLIKGLIR